MVEFNVGDECQIKDLDELVEEFGQAVKGTCFGWNPNMEKMCGQPFTIARKESTTRGSDRYFSEEKIEYCRGGTFSLPWSIGADILKRREPDVEVSEEDFMNVLFS